MFGWLRHITLGASQMCSAQPFRTGVTLKDHLSPKGREVAPMIEFQLRLISDAQYFSILHERLHETTFMIVFS
jgi:hypothetical protein